MPNLKQPFAGIAASALVIAVSLGFISLYDAPKFMGWVSFCLISIIPMEIVIGIAWGCEKPEFAASCPQPLKGFLLILLTLLVGAVGGAATRALEQALLDSLVLRLQMRQGIGKDCTCLSCLTRIAHFDGFTRFQHLKFGPRGGPFAS